MEQPEQAPPADPVASDGVRHKVQLGLSVGLLSYAHVSLKPDTAGADSVSTSTVHVGTLESAAVTIGYGITKAVIVAADVEGSYQHRSVTSATAASSGSFSLSPTIQFMLPDTPLYLGAKFEVNIVSTTDSGTDETDTLFGAGGTIGAHAFIADSVSIDPEFIVAYVGGSGTVKDSSGSTDVQLSGFVLGLGLGLSAWL